MTDEDFKRIALRLLMAIRLDMCPASLAVIEGEMLLAVEGRAVAAERDKLAAAREMRLKEVLAENAKLKEDVTKWYSAGIRREAKLAEAVVETARLKSELASYIGASLRGGHEGLNRERAETQHPGKLSWQRGTEQNILPNDLPNTPSYSEAAQVEEEPARENSLEDWKVAVEHEMDRLRGKVNRLADKLDLHVQTQAQSQRAQ